MKDYLGFGIKEVLVFLVFIGATTSVVTGGYILLNGYQKFDTNMNNAQQLMLSGFQGQNNNGVDSMVINPQNGGQYQSSNLIQGGQFCCPKCGRMSLPYWTMQGTPICPNCGSVMKVITAQSSKQVAAWGGG